MWPQQAGAQVGRAPVQGNQRDGGHGGVSVVAQLREAEAGGLLGDEHVAGEGELEAAAEAHAVDHADGGEREHVEGVHDAVDAVDEAAELHGVLAGRRGL